MGTKLRFIRYTLAVAVIGVGLGCSNDYGVVPIEMDRMSLAGAWRGSEFSLTSQENPALKVDLVRLGGSISLSITPAGAFTGTAVVPGAALGQPGSVTVPLSGLVRVVSTDTLRIDFVPERKPVFRAFAPRFVLDQHILTFVDEAARFDFTGDGEEEPTTLVGSFVRN